MGKWIRRRKVKIHVSTAEEDVVVENLPIPASVIAALLV
jgi:hypothetical protein